MGIAAEYDGEHSTFAAVPQRCPSTGETVKGAHLTGSGRGSTHFSGVRNQGLRGDTPSFDEELDG